jgi:hypothetical protein
VTHFEIHEELFFYFRRMYVFNRNSFLKTGKKKYKQKEAEDEEGMKGRRMRYIHSHTI